MTNIITSPQLLADTPAGIDLLGAHSRVAQGISNLINGSEGGKTIALEGGWGSGKSTVIQLLDQKYSNSNVVVHVYDAWIHAGDPLRRAFLTSLIGALQQRNWLSTKKAEWDQELDKLSRRYKENTKRTVPILTTFGKLLAVSLLLVPLGMSAFGESMRRCAPSTQLMPSTSCSGLFITLGLLLACAPLLLLVGGLSWRKIKKQSIDGIFELVLNRTTLEEKTSITETGDPTTIEFQSLFAKALSEALSGTEESDSRKLVLVIDNLDRITADEARDVWSLLRSFVDMPQLKQYKWTSRFWVIVPIANKIDDTTDDSEPFHDKIFQARFTLPPPVLKGWREHLKALLNKAFPPAFLKDEKRLLDLYLLLLVPGQSPTPRELVLFVNQLVALSLQWKERFSLSILAAYVLETKGRDIRTSLLDKTIPRDSIKQLLNSELTSDFACIYFNTGDSADALEILQRPLAETLLTEGNGERLFDEISEEPSFADIAGNVLNNQVRVWAQGEVIWFLNSITAILDARVRCQESDADLRAKIEHELIHLQSRLEELIPSCFSILPVVPMLAPNFAAAIVALLKRASTESTTDAVKTLIQRFPKMDSAGLLHSFGEPYKLPEAQNIDSWVKNFLDIAQYPVIHDAIIAKQLVLNLPITPKNFVWLLDECCKRSLRDLYLVLEPAGGSSALVAYLKEEATTAKLSSTDIMIIDWLEGRGDALDLKIVSSAIAEGLKSGTEIDAVFLDAVAIIFATVKSTTLDINETQKLAVEQGTIAHHFFKKFQENNFSLAGALAWCQLVIRSDGNVPIQWNEGASAAAVLLQLIANPASQPELAKGLRDFILSNDVIGDWMTRVIQQNVLATLTAWMFEDEALLTPYLKSLPISSYRIKIDEISNILFSTDISKSRAFRQLSLTSRRDEQNFSGNIANQIKYEDDAWLCLVAIEVKLEPLIPITDAASKMLLTLNETQWGTAFKKNSDVVNLAIQLIDRGAKLQLGHPLRIALHDSIESTISTSSTETLSQDTFGKLVTALEQMYQRGLADAIYEDTASLAVAASENYWKIAGQYLLESILRNGTGQRAGVGRRIFLPLVKHRDHAGLIWLVNAIQVNNDISALMDDDVSLRELADEVASAIQDPSLNQEAKEILLGLAKLLPKLLNGEGSDSSASE